MFNLPEFHELQRQHCKDLLEEAERERLAQEAVKAQQSENKLTSAAHSLVSRLNNLLSGG